MANLSSEELQSLIKEISIAVVPFMEEESAEKIQKVLELLESEEVANPDWEHKFKEENFFPTVHYYNFFKNEQTDLYTKRNSVGISVFDPDSKNHATNLSYQKQVRPHQKPQAPEKKTGILSGLKNKLLKAQQEKETPVPKSEPDEPLREDSLFIDVSPMGVKVSDIRTPVVGGETRKVDYVLENGILTKRINDEVVSTTQLNARENN